jgi:hypothetical protein
MTCKGAIFLRILVLSLSVGSRIRATEKVRRKGYKSLLCLDEYADCGKNEAHVIPDEESF